MKKMGYKGLKVYEKSYNLALSTYRITKELPREELYGMISQMRRASLSIPLNIAEGYARKINVKDYKYFLQISLGSSNEMQVLLEMAKDLRYISKETFNNMLIKCEEIQRMLIGMINSERI